MVLFLFQKWEPLKGDDRMQHRYDVGMDDKAVKKLRFHRTINQNEKLLIKGRE